MTLLNDQELSNSSSNSSVGEHLSRRGFLRGTGGLVIGLALGGASRAEADTDDETKTVDGYAAATPSLSTPVTNAIPAPAPASPAPGTPVNTWLTIGTDNTVTLTIGSSEMGQGSFSGLAQILSEDLFVDYARIRTVQGKPSLLNPAPVGAALTTVGSGITRNNYWKLRDAAATAREMLVSAALVKQKDANRSNYSVTDGVIRHTPTGTTYTYGSVAAAAATMPILTGAPLVPDNQLKVIGKKVRRVDIPAKVTGAAKYGIDIALPGMVYAIIKHSPALGGTLKAYPSTPPGMIAVVPTAVVAGTNRGLEATGNVNAVAVVGPNTWDTMQAARRLSVAWNPPPNASALGSFQFLADGMALLSVGTPYAPGATNGPGTVYTVEGARPAADAAIAGATKTVDATYTLPYVAHACMEVLNCTVDYVAGVKCDIYAPTQAAKAVLTLAMTLTGLPAAAINVTTTYLGGGLGRKAEVDFVSQAIQVAMRVGKPVKLMWPREEDFTHDQYRPMAVVKGRAGLDGSGKIVGLNYRNVSPSILGQRGAVLPATGDSQGYEGSNHLPYDIGSRVIEWVSHPSPIPVGFWRSVGASINTFAVECLIDELASAAGVDGYTFRKARLTDPRWTRVLDVAAQLGGWGTPLAAGRGRGIAIGTAFNSIVAQVVEVSNVTATSVRIEKVSVALDAYLTVNPDQVDAQIVGGVVHGLNAALYGKQTFIGATADAKQFRNSRMIRMNEMPKVAVSVVPNPAVTDRAVPIGGVGELGVPTFAPALANACFAANGARIRNLPLFPNATMGGL